METITDWLVYQAIIRSIRDYYAAFSNADDILDRTIHEENNIVNRTISGKQWFTLPYETSYGFTKKKFSICFNCISRI
jgi:hypothetical protein